ncbi:MAG TPA: hypothetical protein VGF15_03685 [Solirubrobacteraceae bacterium]
MRTRHRRAHLIDDLRLAIDCLPLQTRVAMLDGIGASERIIVGAYVDRRGGVCPMLAAHRHGGRTDFLGFAKSWDRFTRASRARRATERELRTLVDQLQASIIAEAGLDLGDVIADHRRLQAASERARSADALGQIVIRRKPRVRRPRSASHLIGV